MALKPGLSTQKNAKGGLLLIFGVMVFVLVSVGFVAFSLILPSQVSSSLEDEINNRMLPSVRTAVEESGHAIKAELDIKRDATLARIKKTFSKQIEAKGKALIKTLLPLVENYDFDTAKQILVDTVDSDSAIAGIHYRLQADVKPDTIGDTSSNGLLSFKVTEKSSFADLEVNLLASPNLMVQAEEEEKSSFTRIEQQMKEANQALEQHILKDSHTMQDNILASLRRLVWLLAIIGVAVQVAITLLVMHRLLIVPLERTKRYLLTISEGNLTQDLDYHSNNELGEMAEAMNTMVKNLRRIVAEINSSVATLNSHSDSLSQSTGGVVQGAREQVIQATQAAAAITELSASFSEVAHSSSSASESARSASEQAQSGRDIVSRTASGMNTIATTVSDSSALISELKRRSEEIGNVINVINGIAEQTNLLALNAAIEAARAGEQGRGFAVVADEVRTLAGRTSEATKEISQMVEKIQLDTSKSVKSMSSVNDQVDSGVELAKKALTAMDKIVQSSDESMQMATSIATAVEQQSVTANEVSGSVENMAMVSRETEEANTSMQLAAQELAQLGSDLNTTTSWFEVNERWETDQKE
ncbi:MAG: methyl-accepting chemotaxis protein [gamma proteobacterium endosymbiont of Lamellibrachia anaximandri]|nr:methyl-accepting chemotaxis protein [gamma proteobacterium endosymbiont of Lamellibrachia anaximandri]MBL3532852.1 methyl-accepting chemotaxis protein [gamma proteobacterium endosymbiont of Lamellibrachia anaximandri]